MNGDVALELIEFALNYNVDYIYVLEDLQKILQGKMNDFNEEDYLD